MTQVDSSEKSSDQIVIPSSFKEGMISVGFSTLDISSAKIILGAFCAQMELAPIIRAVVSSNFFMYIF